MPAGQGRRILTSAAADLDHFRAGMRGLPPLRSGGACRPAFVLQRVALPQTGRAGPAPCKAIRLKFHSLPRIHNALTSFLSGRAERVFRSPLRLFLRLPRAGRAEKSPASFEAGLSC